MRKTGPCPCVHARIIRQRKSPQSQAGRGRHSRDLRCELEGIRVRQGHPRGDHRTQIGVGWGISAHDGCRDKRASSDVQYTIPLYRLMRVPFIRFCASPDAMTSSAASVGRPKATAAVTWAKGSSRGRTWGHPRLSSTHGCPWMKPRALQDPVGSVCRAKGRAGKRGPNPGP